MTDQRRRGAPVTLECALCGRAAIFLVRIEFAAGQHTRCRRHACSHHVVELVMAERGWADSSKLADGRLTVLVIDPHLSPGLATLGSAENGFPFYSTSTPPADAGITTRHERTASWGA
jgi:hypothetical protein